jgi:lipoyl-dependent peroxiredoxin
MKYTAKAHWKGNLKLGKGTLSTQSGALDQANYSYPSRFEEGQKGTNPEELLAAAHAGCFTMAVCSNLTRRGFDPLMLDTRAIVTMENAVITGSHLVIDGRVDEISREEFTEAVQHEAAHCIISKALAIPVTFEARLLS